MSLEASLHGGSGVWEGPPECVTFEQLVGGSLPFAGQEDSILLDLDAAVLVITLGLVRNT